MGSSKMAGASVGAGRVQADEILNLSDVAKRIGEAIRGKAYSPQRVRMLTDRVIDKNGNPGPLKLVTVRMGKRNFVYIADGDPDLLILPGWPAEIGDSVAEYIEGVRSGRYQTRTASGRIVFHATDKVDGNAAVVTPDGWVLPEGLTLVAALEALAAVNGIAYKYQEKKESSTEDDESDEDDTESVAAAAKLAREQQVNSERGR